MRKLFLAACLLFVACGTADLSGTYICRSVKVSSQSQSPSKIADEQECTQDELLNRSAEVVQYDETIWIGLDPDFPTNGGHLKKISNNEYIGKKGGDEAIAKFSNGTLSLKIIDKKYTYDLIYERIHQ